ncbi:MAG: glycosyltransferase family 9 protein [Candidatus Omnitrophica bacterium]|nr:glycosyltransferase family 9 protein [Candidatus Omnitrophota bacterium]
MKIIIRSLGLGKLARGLRYLGFFCFDFFGSLIFIFIPKKRNSIPVKKILLIRLDRIGDIILSTPAIRSLKRKYPQAQIHLLINEYIKDLVVNNPNIDKLLIYNKDELDNDYDIAVAFHPGLLENHLTFKSGASLRVGFKGRGGSFFLSEKIADDRNKRIRHEVISNLEVVSRIGCSMADKDLEVSITDEGERFSEKFFKENALDSKNKTVVIHPGARQEYIRWRKSGFAQLADRLIQELGLKVIISASKDEEGLVKEITGLMNKKPIVVIGIRLTELVSLIKRSDLFIGNSTGPMHIAAALKKPVVAIFGSKHPLDSFQEWGPYGTNSIVVTKNDKCLKCHPSDCRTFECMENVMVDDVWQAVQKLLELEL